MIQLLHPYMTTGKSMALTTGPFVVIIIYFLKSKKKKSSGLGKTSNMKHSFNFFKFCRNISEFYYKMCFLLFRALDKGKDQHPFNNMDRQDYPLKHSQGCQSGISLHPDFFRVLIPNCPKTWKQLLLFPIVILPNSVNVILASFQITPRDIVLNFF